MRTRSKEHIKRTILSKLVAKLIWGLYLVLTTGCSFFVKYSVNEEMSETVNSIQSNFTPLGNGYIANQVDNDGKTTLHIAAENGDVITVAHLLNDPNTDVNATCKDGKTALYLASERNHVAVVALFINNDRVDLNKGNGYGNNPLHIATSKGNIEVVKTLLKADGISVDAKNLHSEGALYIAFDEFQSNIIELLLKDPRKKFDNLCSICRETVCLEIVCIYEHSYINKCGHCFHSDCIKQWYNSESNNEKKCPNCMVPYGIPYTLYSEPV